jgi:hypothetical protein
VQFETCVLDVFRYTEMLACSSVPTLGPLSVTVRNVSAVPAFMPVTSVDSTMPVGIGSVELSVRAIVAHVSWSVPVASAPEAALKLNGTVVPALPVVPEPEVTVPVDDDTSHAVPARIALPAVAVMLAAVPATSAGCEKLTVVGNA